MSACNGPVEKLVTELQQSRKMHMVEHLQAKLLEDQRRSLKHFENVQSGLSIMREGAMRSRPSTSPAVGIAEATAQELGLQRMSFTETLRAEVEASRSACGIIAEEENRTSKTAPTQMAQIPEQPEMERPKTSPAKDGSASQSLSTRGFKSMKTAGTVKFQNASGSGPLGVSWTDGDEEFYRFHEESLYPSNVRDLTGLSDKALFRQKGQNKILSHSSDVISFDFCDSGQRLATATREGQLSVWNVADREQIWSASMSSCKTMAFSSSGKLIAAVTNEGLIHSWNLADPKSATLHTFNAGSKVHALAFSMEKGLALATTDKVLLLATPSLQEVATLPQTGDVHELSFSPDGSFLVAAGLHVDPRSSIMAEDGDPSAGAVFWEVNNAFQRLGAMVFQQVLRVTTFRPDGKLLALAGDNKLITLLDVLNDFDHDGDLPCGQAVHALAWSPNLRCLAAGGEDHMVTVWDMASKHVLFQMDPVKDCIFRLAWSANGLLAFSHLGAQGVRLAPLEEVPDEKVDIEGPQEEEEVEETPQFVFLVKVASTPGGPVEPKKVSEEGFKVDIKRDRVDLDATALDLSNINLGLQVGFKEPTFVTGHHLISCSFTPHETLMVAGEDVFEFEVERKVKNREIHLRDVAKALAVSPCGGYLAVANAMTVTVHRLMSKGQEAVLTQKVTSNIVALAFSVQHFLAVGTLEKKVLVFPLEGNQEPEVLSVQVNHLCFSPVGDLLAIPGGDDGTGEVSLWQVSRESCEYRGLVNTRSAANVACFSEPGKILAVGCEDCRVVLLAPEHGFQCWTELRCDFPVRYLSLSGSFLAAASNREICVFSIASSQITLQLPKQEDRLQNISMNSSGSLLACCFRGHVTLLPLESVTEVSSLARASIKVPDDKDRYKSRGTVTSLSLKSSPSDIMHTVQLSFANVQAADDGELQVSRSLKSTGSCDNLGGEDSKETKSFHKSLSMPSDSKVGEDSTGSAYIPGKTADGGDSPPPWLLKPRISVTDMSQGEGSRCTTPGEKEEDPEARALRKRQLLARDLGLDPAIQSKISIAARADQAALPIKLKHKDEVMSLSFHGGSLLAGGYDQDLVIWEAESHVRSAEHHIESEILCVSFSPCGEYVFCGDRDKEINVFKAKTLELMSSEVLKDQFGCLAGISSPTQLLAVGCTAVVKIFAVPKLEEVISLEHGGQVHSLSFSPSMGMLAAAGGINLTDGLLDYSHKDNRGMKAMVWKSSEFAGVWNEVATVNYQDFCHAAAFAPTGHALALAGEDRLISILSVHKNFRKVTELPCGAGIRCLSWTPSSRLLASAGEDMRVSVWDVLFKRVVLHLPKADDWLCCISFSADSKWLAACGYGQETVDLWPIEVEEKDFTW